MSEPDSTPRRRPPTIDLTATEVETEPPASAQDLPAGADAAADQATTGAAPRDSMGSHILSRARPYAVGAAAGAVVVVVVVAAIWFAGLVPTHETAAPPSTPAPKVAANDEISSRLDKIQQALQAPRSDEGYATRIASAEAQTKSLGEQFAALTRRLDETAAAAQSALREAKAATAAADAAKSAAQNAAQAGVQHGDIDVLAKRVAALEGLVKSLTADMAQRSPSTDDRVARATLAAEALRAAVERGAPYQAELDLVQSLISDPNATAPLVPFAASGVPSAAALGRELATLTPALLRASGAATKDGSFLGRLESHAQRLVRVTPLDAPTGDDPVSVVARLDADAARGDIAAALADLARLPQPSRTVAEAWSKKAQAREQAVAASRRIAADALAGLGRPASQ